VKIERVELQGFRSFRDLVAFDFTDRAGVVKLSGVNDDEPDLGANGAGKSTMWEGVHWCLFGASSRGLKGPELETWNAGHGIRVLVRIAGKDLVRTWSAKAIAALTLAGDQVTQDEVNAWLGILPEAFSHCSYIAQRASTFLDLSASDKTDLLASVLNLNEWDQRSSTAKARASSLKADIEELSLEIANEEGALATLETTDYEDEADRFERKRKRDIAEMQDDLAELNDSADDLEAAEATAKRSVHSLRTTKGEAREQLDKVIREHAQAILHRVEAERARRSPLCPTCKRPWSDEWRNGLHTHTSLAALERDEETLARAEDAATALAKKIDASLRDAEATHQQVVTRLAETKRDIRGVLAELSAERAAVNPYERLLSERGKRIAQHRQRMNSMSEERDLLRAELVKVEYWITGFKDVRLFLITEALTHLEVEVNSALSLMGLREWAIKFAPDSTTKGGNVKRGFTVMIQSPSNQRPVPWAVWSGGEAQRLRLATAMGISNLISAYTGYQPFVEVWDEPSDGMSREGIDDMLRAFEQRAHAEARQVWVVDHRALESGVFSETITAVKKDGTTTLERELATQGE
jgi:DNA repair exonuclease SbcCD ATPase subunit